MLTYVLITGVRSNETNCLPSIVPSRVVLTGMLLKATKSFGISISKSKVAFRLGSSKHGKACRASHASNWVLIMTCCSPSFGVPVTGAPADLYLARQKPAIWLLMVPVKSTTRTASPGWIASGKSMVARSDVLSYEMFVNLCDFWAVSKPR